MKFEATQIELFPDNIAQRIDYIRLNSSNRTLDSDQNELANINSFYSFGLEHDILGNSVSRSTVMMEAGASFSILSIAIAKKDMYLGLLAVPVIGLLIRDIKLYIEDPNRHENLTLDGKRRQYIHELRLQLNDENKN